jgi:hypothetical protein
MHIVVTILSLFAALLRHLSVKFPSSHLNMPLNASPFEYHRSLNCQSENEPAQRQRNAFISRESKYGLVMPNELVVKCPASQSLILVLANPGLVGLHSSEDTCTLPDHDLAIHLSGASTNQDLIR